MHPQLARVDRLTSILPLYGSIETCFCVTTLQSPGGRCMGRTMYEKVEVKCVPLSSISSSEARTFCCSMLGASGLNRPSFWAFFQARTLSVSLQYVTPERGRCAAPHQLTQLILGAPYLTFMEHRPPEESARAYYRCTCEQPTTHSPSWVSRCCTDHRTR